MRYKALEEAWAGNSSQEASHTWAGIPVFVQASCSLLSATAFPARNWTRTRGQNKRQFIRTRTSFLHQFIIYSNNICWAPAICQALF